MFLVFIVFFEKKKNKDPYRNLVKKCTNLKTINGVYSSELQLSDQPILGEWKIKAEFVPSYGNEQVRNLAITKQAFVTHPNYIYAHELRYALVCFVNR